MFGTNQLMWYVWVLPWIPLPQGSVQNTTFQTNYSVSNRKEIAFLWAVNGWREVTNLFFLRVNLDKEFGRLWDGTLHCIFKACVVLIYTTFLKQHWHQSFFFFLSFKFNDITVKLSLCLTKHYTMKTWQSGGIVLCIPNLDTIWRYMPVNFAQGTTKLQGYINKRTILKWH
jgi:hypothetical protein